MVGISGPITCILIHQQASSLLCLAFLFLFQTRTPSWSINRWKKHRSFSWPEIWLSPLWWFRLPGLKQKSQTRTCTAINTFNPKLHLVEGTFSGLMYCYFSKSHPLLLEVKVLNGVCFLLLLQPAHLLPVLVVQGNYKQYSFGGMLCALSLNISSFILVSAEQLGLHLTKLDFHFPLLGEWEKLLSSQQCPSLLLSASLDPYLPP